MLPDQKIIRYPDLTALHLEAVEATVRSIIESDQFRKSKRYPAFLEFIVRNSLTGNFEVLKERILGAEIFGREPDWDAGNDSIVRNAAVEVRKRMHMYFSDYPEEPVRIDLRPGSYIAEFYFIAPGATPPPFQPSDLYFETTSTVAYRPRASRLRKAWVWLWNPWWRAALTALLILVGTSAGIWRYAQNEAGEHALWEPVLHNNQPAIIIAGNTFLTTIPPRQLPETNSSQPPGASGSPSQDTSDWKLNDPAWVSRICTAFFIFKKGDCNILSASTMTMAELRNKALVLIGGPNNPLTDQFLEPLRYQFRTTPWVDTLPHQERVIVDQWNPQSISTWRVAHDPPSHDPSDYAIVARFYSNLSASPVLIIGGLRPEGTEGAGEFITTEEGFQQVATLAPKGWKGINFEAVLRTESAPENAGHVKILATYFW